MRHRNVIGPQVRKLRYRHRWSQITFATKLQHGGWNVSRETVAKIESRRRMVLDVQVLYLAEVLEVPVGALFPKTHVRRRPIERVLNRKNFHFPE
jgi:transcriptional regulator with XRE-family HTH domain